MARTAGSHGPKTAEAIRAAGLRLIYAHGYEGMSLRDLAAEVGIQPGSLYNHIATKQALLVEVVSQHMRELIAALDAALAGVEDPLERLAAFVDFHLRYHLARRMEVFVINSELRSLEPENRAAVVALRRAYEERLTAIIAAAAAAGLIVAPDARVATYAVIALLTGVSAWYRPDGRLDAETLVTLHRRMAFGALGATAPGLTPPTSPRGGEGDPQAQEDGGGAETPFSPGGRRWPA